MKGKLANQVNKIKTFHNKIKDDEKKDKSVGFASLLIVTVYLEFFWTLKENITSYLHTLFPASEKLVTVIVFLLGLISASSAYYFIFYIVKRIYLKKWAKQNSAIWVDGDWIHVHVKDTIRVGFVHIEQEFNNLKVFGCNIDPHDTFSPITEWKYAIGRVSEEEKKSSGHSIKEFYGSYCAERISQKLDDKHTVKYGVHRMTIRENVTDKYPIIMDGYFGDTAKSSKGEKLSQHYGSLFFFKISDDVKSKFNSENTSELLKIITEAYKQNEENLFHEINPSGLSEIEFQKRAIRISYNVARGLAANEENDLLFLNFSNYFN